jgi:hypothetical protein
MLLWIIQMSIISIILIFVVQNLIYFFKSTLTVPKIKDLVNSPQQKYEAMFNIISSSQNNNSSHISTDIDEFSTYIKPPEEYIQSLLPPVSQSSMKTELKQFLKNKLSSV